MIKYVIEQDTKGGLWTSEPHESPDLRHVRQVILAGWFGEARRAVDETGGILFGVGANGRETKAVCPRCLDIEPGKPAGDPNSPHRGPFADYLCDSCARAVESVPFVSVSRPKGKGRDEIVVGNGRYVELRRVKR